jgi:hypothetical protein
VQLLLLGGEAAQITKLEQALHRATQASDQTSKCNTSASAARHVSSPYRRYWSPSWSACER